MTRLSLEHVWSSRRNGSDSICTRRFMLCLFWCVLVSLWSGSHGASSPTSQPSNRPSHRPSCQPSSKPTKQTSKPSPKPVPTKFPTSRPTNQPAGYGFIFPSRTFTWTYPSHLPSHLPSPFFFLRFILYVVDNHLAILPVSPHPIPVHLLANPPLDLLHVLPFAVSRCPPCTHLWYCR